jgi:hypothetical protein
VRRNGGHIRAPRARDHDDVGSPSPNRLEPDGQQGKRSRGRPSWYGRSSSSSCSCGCLRTSCSMPTVRVASLGGRGVAARHDVPHALIQSLLGVTRDAACRMLGAGVLPAFHDGNHRWLLAFSLAWKAPPGGRGEARRKLAPQSIPPPLVRCLVAWVAPSAVLRASAGIVGRRASLTRHLTPKTCQKHRAENTATSCPLY